MQKCRREPKVTLQPLLKAIELGRTPPDRSSGTVSLLPRYSPDRALQRSAILTAQIQVQNSTNGLHFHNLAGHSK